jgi:hypothetical protein
LVGFQDVWPLKSQDQTQVSMQLTRYLAKSGEGTPKELLITELPTLRAILQLGLHLQEEKITMEEVDKRNYNVKDLCNDLAAGVLVPWVKANALFQAPVITSCKSLSNRIQNYWQLAQRIVNNKAKKKETEKFNENLDKMYDLTKCRCPILTCDEFEKCADYDEKCKADFHILCQCVRAEKLPLLELGFILSQRNKVGEKGGMQITGQPDREQCAMQENIIAKNELKEERAVKKETKKTDVEVSLKERSDDFYRSESNPEDSIIDPLEVPRNMMDISQTAQTAIRYAT